MVELEYPDNLKYSADHEWVLVQGETARVGITDYAQDALGDIVYVQLPESGETISASHTCGEVESTKSVSEQLENSPELLNSDPYGEGWLFEVAMSDVTEVDGLMDAKEYQSDLP